MRHFFPNPRLMAAFFVPASTFAQSACNGRGAVLAQLAKKYIVLIHYSCSAADIGGPRLWPTCWPSRVGSQQPLEVSDCPFQTLLERHLRLPAEYFLR